jgi:hypothetical protein
MHRPTDPIPDRRASHCDHCTIHFVSSHHQVFCLGKDQHCPSNSVLLDSNPAEARFLTPEERLWAIERLRDNNTGLETSEWTWGTLHQVGQSSLLVPSSLITEKIKGKQVLETLLSPQIWLFVALSFCLNFGASVTNVFGPLIIKGIGFDSRVTILLNIPFGESRLALTAFATPATD